MSRAVLWAGERLGRFAILLFALPLLLPLVVWLYFLDRHPLIVVAGGAAFGAIVESDTRAFPAGRPIQICPDGMGRAG